MFTKPAADPKPTLYQVGTITYIKETEVTTSGSTFKKQYTLEGEAAAHQAKSYGTLFYHPVFFSKGYSVNSESSKWLKQCFLRHILRPEQKWDNFDPKPGKWYSPKSNQVVGISFFQAACGSYKNYVNTVDALQEIFLTCNGDGEFAEKLDEVFATFVGNQVGYVLKQQYEDSEERNEKGFAIPVPGKYYEIAGFFYPDEKGIEKKILKAVEKFNEKPFPAGYKAIMCFDNEVPFSGVGATSN